jgi:hypothetical protein
MVLSPIFKLGPRLEPLLEMQLLVRYNRRTCAVGVSLKAPVVCCFRQEVSQEKREL